MKEDTPGDEAEYGLLIPFVVVTSKGGPYDDKAFVAGARYGKVAEILHAKPEEFNTFEYPEMIPQFDLLAMHEGYTMKVTPWVEYPEDWVELEFKKISEDEVLSDGTD